MSALEQATRNALLTTDVCGSDVPVYVGAGAPLIRPLQDAHWFHGSDGFGDRGYPAPKRIAGTPSTRSRRSCALPAPSRASRW